MLDKIQEHTTKWEEGLYKSAEKRSLDNGEEKLVVRTIRVISHAFHDSSTNTNLQIQIQVRMRKICIIDLKDSDIVPQSTILRNIVLSVFKIIYCKKVWKYQLTNPWRRPIVVSHSNIFINKRDICHVFKFLCNYLNLVS